MDGATAILGEDDLIGWQGHRCSVSEDDRRSRGTVLQDRQLRNDLRFAGDAGPGNELDEQRIIVHSHERPTIVCTRHISSCSSAGERVTLCVCAPTLVANYNSIIIMWLLDIDDRRTASPPGPVPRASPASSPYVFVVQACTLGLSTKNCLLRLDELLRRLRGFVLCEDRLHRTHRLARSAVDTLVGVYEELIRALVDTVDRADLDTG